MSKLLSVSVRYEGDINSFVSLRYADGSEQHFSSIEGPWEDDASGSRVFETDPVMDNFLHSIWEKHAADSDTISELELDSELNLLSRVDEPAFEK
jgi:hypothetical protein